jgi:ABC-type transporter Mla subunit MlaD
VGACPKFRHQSRLDTLKENLAMQESRRNLLVGVFVLVGIGALGTLVILFGQAPTWILRVNTYPIYVHFEQVAGVREGTLVTAKGIQIGRVDKVGLLTEQELIERGPAGLGEEHERVGQKVKVGEESGVSVRLAIFQKFQIPVGSKAVTTEPVLGQGRPPIEIIPGPEEAEALPPGGAIVGTVRRGLESFLPGTTITTLETTARQIGGAAEALTPVLDEMRVLLQERAPELVDAPGGPQGNISSAVARMDSAIKHFNDVLGDPNVKSQVRLTVDNVHVMSERGVVVMDDLQKAAADAREVMQDARRFVSRAEETLGTVDTRVTDVAQQLRDSLDRVDVFLDSLNGITSNMAKGEGTIGQLLVNEKLYEALTLTAQRLSLAVEDFRALIAEWRQGKIRIAL